MSKPKHTIESLTAETNRLRQLNRWLTDKLEEAESLLGVSAPVLILRFKDHEIRALLNEGTPVILADDVVDFIPDAPEEYRHGEARYPVAVQRLRRLHIGAREAISLRRADVASSLGMTERSLSKLLGVPTRAHWIGFVTPLGIESLRDRAPEFCAWVEREAFPAVIERFGKGGAA